MRTAVFTLAALVAFAANSVLCRLALGQRAIDPASFTTVRLVSGALALWIIRSLARGQPASAGSWFQAGALFAYAVAFSFAYTSLGASTGALILFASVQATMIVAGLRAGEHPGATEWIGLAVALGGLVALVRPGLAAPSAQGSALMATAGVAWGVYSLRGRSSSGPLTATAGNFARTVPLVLALSLLTAPARHASSLGVALAVVSGAVASGLGYVSWYAALPRLTATRAAIVQLAVPVLAAAAGVVFLSESLSLRLLGAGAAIVGGVALAVLGQKTQWRESHEKDQETTGSE